MRRLSPCLGLLALSVAGMAAAADDPLAPILGDWEERTLGGRPASHGLVITVSRDRWRTHPSDPKLAEPATIMLFEGDFRRVDDQHFGFTLKAATVAGAETEASDADRRNEFAFTVADGTLSVTRNGFTMTAVRSKAQAQPDHEQPQR